MKLTKLFMGSLIAVVVFAQPSFAQTDQMGMMSKNEGGHGERPAYGATAQPHRRLLSVKTYFTTSRGKER